MQESKHSEQAIRDGGHGGGDCVRCILPYSLFFLKTNNLFARPQKLHCIIIFLKLHDLALDINVKLISYVHYPITKLCRGPCGRREKYSMKVSRVAHFLH